jgi:hypothetical protein
VPAAPLEEITEDTVNSRVASCFNLRQNDEISSRRRQSDAYVGTVVALNLEDYFPQKKRWWLRLRKKNGKLNDMPCHHKLKAYLDTYIDTAGTTGSRKGPLVCALGKGDRSSKSDVYIRYVV